jgi:hypothetical protein
MRTSARRDVAGRRRRAAVPLVAVVVLGSTLVACEGEQGANDRPKTAVMDDFESGALAGWQAVGSGSGAWFVYSDGQEAPDPAQSDPNAPFFVPDPPQGGFAAVTDMNGPGTRILYRDVGLDGRSTLHLTVFYEGSAPFSTPDTLAYESPEPNQQFRIDLIDPTAPIDSVADGDVLINVFHTSPADPTSLAPTAVSVDVSPWAGQTVRLRLAQSDNQGPLRAGVDNIRFEPIGAGADARIELLDTPEPTSALELVLHRLTETEALAALETFVREEASADRFSGAVLVAKDGEMLLSEAYGLADHDVEYVLDELLIECARGVGHRRALTFVGEISEVGERLAKAVPALRVCPSVHRPLLPHIWVGAISSEGRAVRRAPSPRESV